MILYDQIEHKYYSDDNNIDWISVTDIIKKLEQPFNAREVAAKVNSSRKSKWYKKGVDNIISIWDDENKKAIELGNWYHEQREKDILSCNSINSNGKDLYVYKSMFNEKGEKIAPLQSLVEGIYPEHFIYLSSLGICGQADRVEIIGDTVNIYDYKSNKEIKKTSYKDWKGKTTKMQAPLSHIEDCNFNHYAIQLSMYMYIILKHNPQYVAGKMKLQHVIFESVGEDKNGYIIHKRDQDGNPVVKEVVEYEIPYMIEEVKQIIDWIKNGKNI